MNLILSLSLLAAAPAGLSLQISSPQTAVFVGEPLKVVVAWRAVGAPVTGLRVETQDFLNQSLLFFVDDGSGKKKYLEYARAITEIVIPPKNLKPGDEVVTNLVLFRGGYVTGLADRPTDALLLPAKGRYSVQAVYMRQEPWVTSNALSVTVAEPTGADREILQAVGRDRSILEANGDAATQAAWKELIRKHPESPYLRWARLCLLKRRGEALHNWQDPDTGELLLDRMDQAGIARVRVKHYREMADDILSDPNWGPFEEEAMALAFSYARASGHQDAEARARKELFEKYPRSATVKQIKANEAENDDPPSAQASPNPKQ